MRRLESSAGSPISCRATASSASSEHLVRMRGSLRTQPWPTLNVPSRRVAARPGEEEGEGGGAGGRGEAGRGMEEERDRHNEKREG